MMNMVIFDGAHAKEEKALSAAATLQTPCQAALIAAYVHHSHSELQCVSHLLWDTPGNPCLNLFEQISYVLVNLPLEDSKRIWCFIVYNSFGSYCN